MAKLKSGTRIYGNASVDGNLIVGVTSTGSLGIGTASPTTLLQVASSSAPIIRVTDTRNTVNLDLQPASLAAYFGTSSNHDLGLQTNSIERLRIDKTGNLLINTQTATGTASQPLQVTGGAYVSGSLGVGVTAPSSLLHLEGSDGVAQIRLQRSGTNIYGIIRQTSAPYGLTYDAVDVNTGAPTHRFRTSADGSTFNEIARFTSSGYLGIGTANPSQSLEVVGGEIKAGRIDTGSEGGQVSFGRSTDNATAWYIDVYGNTSTPTLRVVDVSSGAVRMTIDSSGRVTKPYTPHIFGSVTNNTTQNSSFANTMNVFSSTELTFTNSRITVPVAGVYMITFTTLSDNVKIGRAHV